ncbi:phosphorylcholine transferase LicD [uncultured Methanobrevibacter sp.]|uniref:LicD family protein n=1 Tax=uncultured Methanobrevibacter sp. TaxID=253161 RepID=UPI0026341229|nr:LicD family protein [uncultured Methanobrevibacter sp.]
MHYTDYSDDTIQKLQKLELMILKDFMAICEKNDIEYFIYGGSALGAVRHGGFIPWDDDIDIIMFRKDYEKFKKVALSKSNDKYNFLTSKTKDYFFLFSKIMLKNTIFEEWWVNQVDFDLGIDIDIFVLDNVPDNKLKRLIHVKRCRFLDRLLAMSVIKFEGYPLLVQTLANIGHGFLKLFNISREKLFKKTHKLLDKYNEKECRYVCDISALHHPQIYEIKDFKPSKKIMFEDVEVNCPNNLDSILTQIYGDYMTLPPESERYNHITQKIDFGPYDE